MKKFAVSRFQRRKFRNPRNDFNLRSNQCKTISVNENENKIQVSGSAGGKGVTLEVNH